MYQTVSSSLRVPMNECSGVLKLPFVISDELCDILSELSIYDVKIDTMIVAAIKTIHQTHPTDFDHFLKWYETQMFESDGSFLRYFEYIGAQPYDVFEYTFNMICTELTPLSNVIKSNIHIPKIWRILKEMDQYILLECR